MNYFDYLRANKIIDTKDNFIQYLIAIHDYKIEEAIAEARWYY